MGRVLIRGMIKLSVTLGATYFCAIVRDFLRSSRPQVDHGKPRNRHQIVMANAVIARLLCLSEVGKEANKTSARISSAIMNIAPPSANTEIPASSSITASTTDSDCKISLVDYVVSGLLTYVGYYRNKTNADALQHTVISFYSPVDI
jgi:hypothetical protein